MRKKILSVMLTVCMVLALMPQMAFAAATETNIPYLDASGTQRTCQSATVVASEDTTWGDDGNEGWYVVKSDVTIGTSETPQRVTVTGDVHLILVDGCTITVNGGIQVQDYDNNFENGCSNSLTIYGQTDSTGTLIAQNAKLYNAAIGGDSDSINHGSRGGDITINGGIVNATSKSGAGIGGSGTGPDTGGSGGTVIINGGIVTATSVRGAAIGGGSGDVGGNGGITIINGGIVNATSKSGANIGGGHGGFEAADSNGTLHISKGVVFMGSGGYVYGSSVTLGTNYTIPDDKTLTIKDMQRLTIPENVTLTNNGTIYNYGNIYNNGTIINNGTINGTVSGNQPVDPQKMIVTNYLDENGEEKSAICKVINTDNIDSFDRLDHDWYMVAGTVTANKRITISGTVNLILADGCNFTANGGIEVIHLDCLRVYAQSTGDNMGKLTANTKGGDNAGIGGSVGNTGGFISIIGGNVTAESINGAGIGGGAGEYHDGVYNGGDGRGVSIIGGNVKASSQYGAGIGGGSGSKGNGGSGGEVIISGGNVTAESTNGAGIGGGGVEESNGALSGGSGGRVTISGGTVKASSQSGAGIGGGSGSRGIGGSGGQVTLSGGTVTATSRNGKGIGGGSGYEGNQVGGSGTFQTNNGNAVVFASSIADKRTINWNGVIFEGNAGMVYGTSVTPTDDFTIDRGKTLLIPEGSALIISGITSVNNGNVYVDGTVSGLGGDLYYPLTVDGGTADKTYTYDSNSYGKAGERIALTGTNIPVGQKATWISTPSVEISEDSFIMPNDALNVTVQFIPLTYTITFDTDGGTVIDSKTGVKWTDTVLEGVSEPSKEGWEFAGWKYRDAFVGAQTTYGELASSDSVSSIELKAQWEDVTKPVISGIVNGNTYCDAVEFEASDNDGIASVKAGDDVLKAGTNGKYTLEKGKGKVTVVAADKTGNAVRATVTINNGHTYGVWQSNGDNTHTRHCTVDGCDGYEDGKCTGGEATCTSKATCEYCGEKYGELDSSNHSLENIHAKDATVTETGNKEYWQCENCKKIFADENGTDEITLDDTVISKLPPEIIEGMGQSITEGEKKALTFRSNAVFDDFDRVELDYETLNTEYYTAESGSIIVTLDADYVAILPVGEHTIGIVSESGTAETTFTVAEKAATGTSDDSDKDSESDKDSVKTGDDANLALWIALMILSGAGIAGTAVYTRRTRRKRTNE